MKMETVMEEGEDSSWDYEMDVTQLCRICANPNEYLIPIFQGEGVEHDLKNKISKHLPIKVLESDKLPTQLCYQCASTLIAWHDMVVGCLEADEKLKALIQDEENENNIMEKSVHQTLSLTGTVKQEPQTVEAVKINDTYGSTFPTQQITPNNIVELEKVAVEEEVTTLEPEFVEEVASEPRCDEMEEDYNDDDNYGQINGIQNIDSELEDEFMSDLESDEEFNILYSCNICNASNMVMEDFLIHTKKHTKEERLKALEKLVDFKITEELAARNAAAAYGFKVEPSLQSSVTLYLCTVCGQGNLLLKNLKEHSTLHPQLTESHFCNLCQQQFHDSSSLAAHLETHLDNNDLICQYCNRRFSIIEDLEQHERAHYQAEYVCVDCRVHFRSRALLLFHLKECHSTGTTCHICEKEFKTDNLIDKHFMTHSAISVVKRVVKYFACDFCAKKYDSKISLQRHILFLHNDRMPFICKHCGFTAYHEDPLKEHLATEHSNNDTLMCCKCGLLFEEKSELDAHMTEHTKEKKYNCKFCGIKFKHLQNLKYHLTSHGDVNSMNVILKTEDEIKQESYDFFQTSEDDVLSVCNHCGETIDGEDMYNTHLKCHLVTVSCDLCGNTFKDELLLNIHLNKVHTSKFCRPDLENGVYPFQCDICKTSFKLEFELEDHSKIHEIPSYQCHLCFQEFVLDKELQEHIRTHDVNTYYETVGTTESTTSEDSS